MKLNPFMIDNYLKENVSIILNQFESSIYLMGGAVRDISNGKIPRDLDFVVLSDSDKEIVDFIQKYQLQYKKNNFNGYKITYNEIEIDIWNSNDLYKCIQYNFDGIFYDIKNKIIIPFGYYDAIETNTLVEINPKTCSKNGQGIDFKKREKRKQKLLKLMKEVGELHE